MGHRDVSCDGCGRSDFTGRRYKCLRCSNYDLCGECYDAGVVTLTHTIAHPTQLILDRPLRELHFDGEGHDDILMPNCFTCPHCAENGFAAKQLIDHVLAVHRHSRGYVVCPMCATMPNVDVYLMRNFANHLLLNHIQHANLIDQTSPPLRRGSTRLARRPRRRYPTAIDLSATNEEPPTDIPETDMTADIIYSLSQMRRRRRRERDRDRESLEPSGIPQRRPALMIGPILDEARRRGVLFGTNDDVSSAIATDNISTPSITGLALDGNGTGTGIEQLIVPTTVTSSNETHTEKDKFLLPKLFGHQKDVEANSPETAKKQLKRAYFTEQLLVSALTHNELTLPSDMPKIVE